MAVACPFCQYELQNNQELCPNCKNRFIAKDWPEKAYSTDGLHPHLTLVNVVGGAEWSPSSGDSFIIGRESHGGLDLNNPYVSRQHVQVKLVDNVWTVQKIDNDFYLNGRKISHSTEEIIHCGDQLSLGNVELLVEIKYEPSAPRAKDSDILEIKNRNTVVLDKLRITIGSTKDLTKDRCDIVVNAPSNFKVLVYKCNGDWWIADCNSPYAVRVNGKRIHNQRLIPGDCISIGSDGVSSANNVFFVYSKHGLKPIESRTNNRIVIRTDGLGAKSKGDVILDDITIQFKPEEFIGILGPSGCGKTSLMQRLIGLAKYTGNYYVNGRSLNKCKSDFLSHCAYLPQDVSLHESLTVHQEMDCFCDLHGSECSHEDIPDALKRVGLESKLNPNARSDARVGALSGGQKKRLGIAMELLRSPDAFLLDEPTSGLDPENAKEVMDYLKTLAGQGNTVLCTTHQTDYFDYFNKVVILSKGRLVFFGTPVDAKTYFKDVFFKQKIQDITPQDIYKLLVDGSDDEQKNRANNLAKKFKESDYAEKLKEEIKETTFPELSKKRPNCSPVKKFFLQVKGYLKRSVDEWFGFINSENKFWDFLFSSFNIQMLLLPLLISQVIKLSCAQKWWDYMNVGDMFFFCLISVFWLGMNNSIKELVSERTPGRCLERLEGVTIWPYIGSKLLWISFLCALQTGIFSALTFGFDYLPPNAYVGRDSGVCWSIGMYFILLEISLIGASVALFISSICKNYNFAVFTLPIILIPVLLFSKPVMEGNNSEKNLRPAVWCYNVSPCTAPLILIKNLNQWNYDVIQCNNIHEKWKNEKDAEAKKELSREECNYKEEFIPNIRNNYYESSRSVLLTLFYFLLIPLTFICQVLNEKHWEGR